MKQRMSIFQSSRTLLIAAMIAAIVVLGGTIGSLSDQSKKSGITINNQTQTCRILSAEQHKGHINLSLRNDSEKNITAFVVSITDRRGDTFMVKEEFAYSEIDFVIAPGEVYQKIISIPSTSSRQNVPLSLLAVVFDDKSSEGDKRIIEGIEDERLGEKIQFSRAIPLLNKMLALQDNASMYFNQNFKHDLATALQAAPSIDLLTQLQKDRPQIMSQWKTDELSEQIKQGLHTGEQYFWHKIQELENLQKTEGEDALREEIIRIKKACERIMSKL